MKKILATIMLVLFAQSAMAGISAEQQQEALNQLKIARSEINTIISLMPGFLKNTIGQNLQSADERIAYAQQVLAGSSVSVKFYCVLETSFDSSFSGTGNTELEAKQNARVACLNAGVSKFWCGEDTTTCTKQ